MYLTARANNVRKWGEPTALAKRMHECKSLISYTCDMDVFMALLLAHRENAHFNFYCGDANFLCNQDMRARVMGCKRGSIVPIVS